LAKHRRLKSITSALPASISPPVIYTLTISLTRRTSGPSLGTFKKSGQEILDRRVLLHWDFICEWIL